MVKKLNLPPVAVVDPPSVEPPENFQSGVNIESVVTQLRLEERFFFRSFGTGNELSRYPYIIQLLKPAMSAADPDEHLKITLEEYFTGTRSGGFVEFVIVANINVPFAPAVFFIEAKQSDFDQARGQLYMELFSGYEKNENHKIPLFGAMTDASRWIFVKYDGTRFTESRAYYVQDRSDVVNMNLLMRQLTWIVKEQSARVTDVVKTYRELVLKNKLP